MESSQYKLFLIFLHPVCHILHFNAMYFLYSKLVAKSKAKELSLPYYLPKTGGREQMDLCISEGHKVKCKQIHPGFKLSLPIPFSIITIMLNMALKRSFHNMPMWLW